MFEFWLWFIGFVMGLLAMAGAVSVYDMIMDDQEDERAAAAARLSLLRRIPPEVYEELADEYPEREHENVVL
ncbi:MAG: hypothetical protein J5494_04145 [Candidatus Methanomethylophilaceae archaeon]|nr:hypothetical protein [Candidatus Methanomethylophilaceae archaeon]